MVSGVAREVVSACAVLPSEASVGVGPAAVVAEDAVSEPEALRVALPSGASEAPEGASSALFAEHVSSALLVEQDGGLVLLPEGLIYV